MSRKSGQGESNFDFDSVASFGDQWLRFNQSQLAQADAKAAFEAYFDVFPWDALPPQPEGFDMGCGSGRWAKQVAPRVGRLNCIEPSLEALTVARRTLAAHGNVCFYQGTANVNPLAKASQDFGYALGVLHHAPEPEAALRACVDLLKPGAPLLVYLYYNFENRPRWFRMIWRLSEILRAAICHLSPGVKSAVTDALALAVYLPLARLSHLGERLGLDMRWAPLSFYRDKSFYTMRTDCRDRFGTPLEHRFARREVEAMMRCAGLDRIVFWEREPYWCAVGHKI